VALEQHLAVLISVVVEVLAEQVDMAQVAVAEQVDILARVERVVYQLQQRLPLMDLAVVAQVVDTLLIGLLEQAGVLDFLVRELMVR
jgi:hypothetical protein